MSWKQYNLGELVESVSIRAKDIVHEDNLKFLGVSNEDGITISKYAAEDKAEDYKIIDKGCFAYNPYRINVGSVGLMKDDLTGLISPAYVVFKPKPNSIIPELLLSFLKSKEGLRQIKLNARGTVRQALRFEDLCKIQLSLPSYDEQMELYLKLQKFEQQGNKQVIEHVHQLDLLRKLRQQILQDAVQGKLVPQDPNNEPASELLERIKTEKEHLIREKNIKKEKLLPPINPADIPFEIPESWVFCRLGEITSLITDGKHGDSKNEENSGYYFLSAKDLQKNEFIYEGARQITYSDFLETHKRTNLEAGDLCVVNTGATIGKTVVPKDCELTERTTFQKSVAVIKVIKPFISVHYIEKLIINQTPNLLKTSRGSAINNLLLGDMRNMIVPLPPICEQTRIVAKIEQLMTLCDELELSIQQNQKYTQELLQVALKEALQPNN